MPDKRSRRYGVRKRGEKYIARPYVPGHGHAWVGTFDTEDEALREAIREYDKLSRLPANKETIRSFKDRWIVKPKDGSKKWTGDYLRAKESTNSSYEREAERFAKAHGSKRLRDFKRIDARRLVRENAFQARVIRAMFTDALDEGLIEVNQFYGIKGINPPPGRKNLVVITAEELETLIEIAKQVHPNYRFWQVVVVLAETGIRPSEAWGLERADFDVHHEELKVQRQIYKGRMDTPKNHQERIIVLPPAAAEAFKTLPRRPPIMMVDERGVERSMDLAFRNKSRDPMGPTSLHRYWVPVRAAFEATLSEERREEFRRTRKPDHPEMDIYELRHWCATNLLERFRENGEDGSYDVANQLGHTDEGELVRKTYGHPDDDLSRERVKRLFKKPDVQPLRPVKDDEEAANG